MSEAFNRVYEIVGLGKIGSNSHPFHPATVHFPIAFLALANIFNLLYGIAIYLPSLSPFTPDKHNTGTLTILGYFLNGVGIITAIPAIRTGFAELYTMISSRGLFITDQKTGTKTLEPIVKTTLLHASTLSSLFFIAFVPSSDSDTKRQAGLNDVTFIGAVYNWLMERNRPHQDYRPYGHWILFSVGALGMVFYAAYLSGGLVYTHGVGVQRMAAGADEKKEKSK